MAWDYDQDSYKKQAAKDPVWYLERLINHDLGDGKLPRALLEKHMAELKIPEGRRAFLELLLWNKPF